MMVCKTMTELKLFRDVQADYPEFLRDESRRIGQADSISFPTSEEELRETLALMSGRGTPVTTQGARTGITAGAVPEGGHILSLSRMTAILEWREPETESPTVVVQPGLSLAELREAIGRRTAGRWFFPPDPTEASASIGGMIACNASGARTFYYGATRRYVRRLRAVLADGSALELTRGREKAMGRAFELRSDSDRRMAGVLPSYRMPHAKHAAGYFVEDDMDLVDLFIGAEGTLGVISQAELELIAAPRGQLAALVFLPDESCAVRLVRLARPRREALEARLVALEYFDAGALSLVRGEASSHGVDIPAPSHAAIYLEWHARQETDLEAALDLLAEILPQSGGSIDLALVATSEEETHRLKDFRHSVPESVNRLIADRKKTAPGITKLGTDFSVPDSRLEEVLALYREGLTRLDLEHVIFGHIGDNHLHVNILPRSEEEYEQGRELYRLWAAAVVRMGGAVSAEHGIGKLKRELLLEMYGPVAIDEMRRLKRVFDPGSILNRGNLFAP
jgi:D-lactate dehydrogenase (cytochrome)